MDELKIKKPKRSNIRRREEPDQSDDNASEEDLEFQSAIEEAKELRKMRKRPSGVSIEDLATLKAKPKESKTKADPLKLKTGGFIDVKALKRELSAAEDIEQIGTSFALETNRCDVDLPMLTYIEEELAKRKGVESEDKSADDKPKKPEDALYELPEHIKSLTARKKTEDMISNTMLSGIPEVDLGIEAKIRNIEATEEAKQRLLQERREKRGHRVSAFVPTNVAVNFVQHNRYNIEDSQPKVKKNLPPPKPVPVRVGDTQPPKTNLVHRPKRPLEKATDDFHFEKFRKSNRRF